MDSSSLHQINEILLSVSDKKSAFKDVFKLINENGDLNLTCRLSKELFTSLILSGKHEKIIDELNLLKKNHDTKGIFELLWKLEEFQENSAIGINNSSKSDTKAAKFTKEGNEFYRNNDLGNALDRYNFSIITARHPDNDSIDISNESSELATGYANRSKVLFELKQYEKCVVDINQALKCGYPKKFHFELYERKIKCYFSLGKIKEAEECINYLKEVGLNGTKDQITEEWILEMKQQYDISRLTNNDSSINQSTDYSCFESMSLLTDSELIFNYTNPDPPHLGFERHPDISGFSNILKLDHSTQKGRFVVTERDIKPGEVIAVDPAYVSCINLEDQECASTYCCFCMKRCLAPIPCSGCTMVVFCGDKCSELAWIKFHRIECGLLSSIQALGYSDSESLIEAYRILSQTPLDTLKKYISKFEARNGEISHLSQGFNSDMKYNSSDYTSVYHLEANLQARGALQILELCGFAVFLTQLLIKSGKYFISEPNREDIVLVGSTLFRHILSIHCNCIGINETQINVENLSFCSTKTKLVGTAVFPSISLLNHSCNPSAMVYSYNNIAVCYAVRFIPAGGEITLKYGKYFYEERDVEVRRSYLLQEYYFTCLCDACAQDWQLTNFTRKLKPELRSLETRFVEKEDECMLSYIHMDNGISSEILLKSELRDVIQDDNRAAMDLRRPWYNPENILDTALKTIEFFDRYVTLPDITYTRAQVQLTECLKIRRPCNFFR